MERMMREYLFVMFAIATLAALAGNVSNVSEDQPVYVEKIDIRPLTGAV